LFILQTLEASMPTKTVTLKQIVYIEPEQAAVLLQMRNGSIKGAGKKLGFGFYAKLQELSIITADGEPWNTVVTVNPAGIKVCRFMKCTPRPHTRHVKHPPGKIVPADQWITDLTMIAGEVKTVGQPTTVEYEFRLRQEEASKLLAIHEGAVRNAKQALGQAFYKRLRHLKILQVTGMKTSLDERGIKRFRFVLWEGRVLLRLREVEPYQAPYNQWVLDLQAIASGDAPPALTVQSPERQIEILRKILKSKLSTLSAEEIGAFTANEDPLGTLAQDAERLNALQAGLKDADDNIEIAKAMLLEYEDKKASLALQIAEDPGNANLNRLAELIQTVATTRRKMNAFATRNS
jgi:hypothetical protein